jgi:hypothetical protein
MDKPKIEQIIVQRIVDDNPDVSWLKTEYEKLPHGKLKIISSCRYDQKMADEHPRRTLRYIMQDRSRLESFGTSWVELGITATAVVSYVEENVTPPCKRLEWLKSGGIWGIESDSSEDYLLQEEQGQLKDLKAHLERFNVDTSNFEEIPITRKDGYNNELEKFCDKDYPKTNG